MPPWNGGSGNHQIAFGTNFGNDFSLAVVVFVGQLLRIAAGVLRIPFQRKFDKLRADARKLGKFLKTPVWDGT